MPTATYATRRGELLQYFDRTAVDAWKRLTSTEPVGGIRATVRAGRNEMRDTLISWLPEDLRGARVLDAEAFDEADHHRHDEHIHAFCITLDRPVHWQGLGMWLEMLIATRGADLLRVKGILNLQGQDRPVAIHAIRHLLHPPTLLPAWPESDPRTSRLVFITNGLSRSTIEEGVRAFEAAAN